MQASANTLHVSMRQICGSCFLIADPFTSLLPEVTTESGMSVGGQVSESRRRTERQLVQYRDG